MRGEKEESISCNSPKSAGPWGEGQASYPRERPSPKGDCEESTAEKESRGRKKQQFNRGNNTRGSLRKGGARRQRSTALQEPSTPEGVWHQAKEEIPEKVWGRASKVQRSHCSGSWGPSGLFREQRRKTQGKGERKSERKRQEQRKAERKRQKRKRKEAWGGPEQWKRWRKGLNGLNVEQLSLLSFTQILVRGLGEAPTVLGATLRRLLSSPLGEKGERGMQSGNPYPLPLPVQALEALGGFLFQSMQSQRRKSLWRQCELAWWGLVILSLNSSGGFTTAVGHARGPLQKEVLTALWNDVACFVAGDGLSNEVVRGPDVSWSVRIADLSLSYTGEICEKARWLTWPQVEPGLPPQVRGLVCLLLIFVMSG